MKLKVLLAFICLSLLFSCKTPTPYTPITFTNKVGTGTVTFKKDHWELYDIEKDTIPGINWYSASELVTSNKTKEPLVVSIIDTEIDFNTTLSKSNLWTNGDEIPDNGIDDDKNGYIDDTNGWNFLGTPSGDNVLYQNYEYVRVVRYYDEKPELLTVVMVQRVMRLTLLKFQNV